MMRRSTSRTRWFWLAMLALTASVAATGCLRGSVDVAVEGDGTGRAVLEIVPDSDVQLQLQDLDVESLVTGPAGSSDLRVEEVEIDGRPGYRVEFSFESAEALGAGLTDGLVIAGEQLTLFESFYLREYDYGAWRLDATLNRSGQQLLARPSEAGTTVEIEELVAQLRSRESAVAVELSVSMPGRLTSTNASRQDGNTAVWDLADTEGPAQLRMATEAAPILTPVQLALLGGLLALLVGVTLAVVGSKRRSRLRGRRVRVGAVAPSGGWSTPPVPQPSLRPRAESGPPGQRLPPMPTSSPSPAPDDTVTPDAARDGADSGLAGPGLAEGQSDQERGPADGDPT